MSHILDSIINLELHNEPLFSPLFILNNLLLDRVFTYVSVNPLHFVSKQIVNIHMGYGIYSSVNHR